ncbi:hypothetical protein PHYPSEUDO_004156 [Phytophthora pseudosyringae]|uniref:Uncharacterized protein n=1 Tax=Phytophthora pseudosyringae TaxID=221518 RepID=A0A8T1WH36_9STRA|nr:hypothetical protein PHYPSEUDO_004156 [Phytophthora pseudosyringae]
MRKPAAVGPCLGKPSAMIKVFVAGSRGKRMLILFPARNGAPHGAVHELLDLFVAQAVELAAQTASATAPLPDAAAAKSRPATLSPWAPKLGRRAGIRQRQQQHQ